MNTVKHKKGVMKILQAMSIDMGGFPVKQALPLEDVQMVDPFLLLHHANVRFDSNQKALHQGVGPHPHRGFSPVTFVISGEVHHRDSRGNNKIASAGEVQWMTAGAGIIHSERPSQKIVDDETEQEIIQLWINSPARDKMNSAEYHFFNKEDIPVVHSDDGKIMTRVVAGTFKKAMQTNINSQLPLRLLWSDGVKGGKEIFELRKNHNSMVYVIKGSIKLNNTDISVNQLAILEKIDEKIEISANSDSMFLVLSGQAIEEPVFQHGPFVMNNRTEILEAMRDYQMGKMGFLVEEELI